VTTRFVQLGTNSLDVEVAAWFDTADFNEFQRIREELLLAFVEVVAQEGASFYAPMVPAAAGTSST
jgi:hypothetical protein